MSKYFIIIIFILFWSYNIFCIHIYNPAKQNQPRVALVRDTESKRHFHCHTTSPSCIQLPFRIMKLYGRDATIVTSPGHYTWKWKWKDLTGPFQPLVIPFSLSKAAKDMTHDFFFSVIKVPPISRLPCSRTAGMQNWPRPPTQTVTHWRPSSQPFWPSPKTGTWPGFLQILHHQRTQNSILLSQPSDGRCSKLG